MRVIAVVNMDGGSVQGQNPETFRSSLSELFAERSIEAALQLVAGTGIKSAAEHAVAEARRRDLDAVIVGGGDGTVRTVASILTRTGIPLGILPLGTLNHFAKALGIPQEMGGALDVIAGAACRIVDVAEVNGEIFINNSSIGIYPHFVLDRDRRVEKSGMSKRLAMIIAVFRLLSRWPVRRLWLAAAGQREQYRTPFLFVGNNAYDLATLGSRATLDAGELWVAIANGETRLAFVGNVVRSLFGAVTESDLRVVKTRSAEVSSRSNRLLVALDGEVQVMRAPLRYRSIAGALRVLASSSPAAAV